MELRHLRYFVAVVDYGTVRAAAEHLNVAQPAISRQIKDLETELGFALFLRQRRGLFLTDAGKRYLEDARHILSAADSAVQEARLVSEGKSGTLSIGLLENACWGGAAPSALSRFTREHPDIQLRVRPLPSLEQIQLIASGELDGGFVYDQQELVKRQFMELPIRRDDVVFAHSEDLVFDHDGELEPGDIDGLPLVGFPRAVAPAYYDRLAAATAQLDAEWPVVQLADNETTMLSLVNAGVACAFVNSANMDRPPMHVRFRKVRNLSVPLEFKFIARSEPGTLAALFIKLLKNIDN